MSAPFATTAAGVASGIGGSLANTALSAGLSFGLNAMSTSKAHDRQKNMMTRGPSYIMQGLRDAGINPILAAGSSGFGGATAKVPQAGSATIPSSNFGQAALLKSTLDLQGANTAKTLAERDIVRAGQPAANWKAAFYATPEGQALIKTSLENEALPKTIPAAGARGVYKLWNWFPKSKPPNTVRQPSQFNSPPPYSVEDN